MRNARAWAQRPSAEYASARVAATPPLSSSSSSGPPRNEYQIPCKVAHYNYSEVEKKAAADMRTASSNKVVDPSDTHGFRLYDFGTAQPFQFCGAFHQANQGWLNVIRFSRNSHPIYDKTDLTAPALYHCDLPLLYSILDSIGVTNAISVCNNLTPPQLVFIIHAYAQLNKFTATGPTPSKYYLNNIRFNCIDHEHYINVFGYQLKNGNVHRWVERNPKATWLSSQYEDISIVVPTTQPPISWQDQSFDVPIPSERNRVRASKRASACDTASRADPKRHCQSTTKEYQGELPIGAHEDIKSKWINYSNSYHAFEKECSDCYPPQPSARHRDIIQANINQLLWTTIPTNCQSKAKLVEVLNIVSQSFEYSNHCQQMIIINLLLTSINDESIIKSCESIVPAEPADSKASAPLTTTSSSTTPTSYALSVPSAIWIQLIDCDTKTVTLRALFDYLMNEAHHVRNHRLIWYWISIIICIIPSEYLITIALRTKGCQPPKAAAEYLIPTPDVAPRFIPNTECTPWTPLKICIDHRHIGSQSMGTLYNLMQDTQNANLPFSSEHDANQRRYEWHPTSTTVFDDYFRPDRYQAHWVDKLSFYIQRLSKQLLATTSTKNQVLLALKAMHATIPRYSHTKLQVLIMIMAKSAYSINRAPIMESIKTINNQINWPQYRLETPPIALHQGTSSMSSTPSCSVAPLVSVPVTPSMASLISLSSLPERHSVDVRIRTDGLDVDHMVHVHELHLQSNSSPPASSRPSSPPSPAPAVAASSSCEAASTGSTASHDQLPPQDDQDCFDTVLFDQFFLGAIGNETHTNVLRTVYLHFYQEANNMPKHILIQWVLIMATHLPITGAFQWFEDQMLTLQHDTVIDLPVPAQLRGQYIDY